MKNRFYHLLTKPIIKRKRQQLRERREQEKIQNRKATLADLMEIMHLDADDEESRKIVAEFMWGKSAHKYL